MAKHQNQTRRTGVHLTSIRSDCMAYPKETRRIFNSNTLRVYIVNIEPIHIDGNGAGDCVGGTSRRFCHWLDTFIVNICIHIGFNCGFVVHSNHTDGLRIIGCHRPAVVRYIHFVAVMSFTTNR